MTYEDAPACDRHEAVVPMKLKVIRMSRLDARRDPDFVIVRSDGNPAIVAAAAVESSSDW